MTELDLGRLQRLAEQATKGPWRVDERQPNVVLPPRPDPEWVGVSGRRTDVPILTGQISNRDRQQWEADAEFIAACSPETVLALVERVREAEAARGTVDTRLLVTMNERVRELESALRDIVDRHGTERDAPGHCHQRSGIWDDDNGHLAGLPCEWCQAWIRARAVLGSRSTTEGGNE